MNLEIAKDQIASLGYATQNQSGISQAILGILSGQSISKINHKHKQE